MRRIVEQYNDKLAKVYRRTLAEVEDLLRKCGFRVNSSKKFVGYFKTKKKIPVRYLLILAQGF